MAQIKIDEFCNQNFELLIFKEMNVEINTRYYSLYKILFPNFLQAKSGSKINANEEIFYYVKLLREMLALSPCFQNEPL